MRNVIAWSKANPISVVAVVLVPVAIALLIYVQLSGGGFKDDTAKEQKSIKTLASLKRSNVEIPSENPEEPMKSESFTITEKAIDKMTRIRDRMDHEFEQIKQWSTRHNRGDDRPYPHRPMIDGLFPHPDGPGKEYDAQAAYKRALYEFTRSLSDDGPSDYPRMNAGRPMLMADVEEKIFLFVEEHAPVETAQGGSGGAASLPEDEYNELRDKAYARMIDLLRDHASRIHLYANTTEPSANVVGDYEIEGDTPFHVEQWVLSGERPTMSQLWEAQVALWIQQDIVEAIALTNRVDDASESVLTAPVKRLLKITVSPDYVGRTGEGLVRAFKGEKVRGSTVKASTRMRGGAGYPMGAGMAPGGMPRGMAYPMAGAQHPGMMPGGPMPFGSTAMRSPSFGGIDGDDEMDAAEEKTEDFFLSPTGRRSNDLYDVRHVTLKVVVDSKRIPLFLQVLSEVNFISVLLTTMKDIDEYSHMARAGEETGAASAGGGTGVYVYGSQDAVELELLLETIWLRSWTAGDRLAEGEAPDDTFNPGLMPDDVRESLGLKRRVPRPGSTREQWSEDDE